jgi:hypothetical protein
VPPTHLLERTRGATLGERIALADDLLSHARVVASRTGKQFVWELRVPGEDAAAPPTTIGRLSGRQLQPAALTAGEVPPPLVGLLWDLWAHDALPAARVGAPLARAARDELRAAGCQVHALARLPGLCGWIVRSERWKTLDRTAPNYLDDQPGAVEACARGVPRPGHSVLGGGTFRAARPAIEVLARAYAEACALGPDDATLCGDAAAADLESVAFRAAGGRVVAVRYMEDTSAAAMADSVGSSVVLEF